MPGITGLGTTYNLPNYVGELFAASPEDTPLLSSIGGLTGGDSVGATLFEWQGYDLRDADDGRQRLEGADAPEGEERVRFRESNVLEIHQEVVSVSFTKQGATKQRNTDGAQMVTIGSTTIPANELAWQLEQQFKQIARDVEKTFITGKFQNPTDNTKPRKTKGLLEAITANTLAGPVSPTDAAKDPGGWDGVTVDTVFDLMQKAWENGGIQESETRTLIVGPAGKRRLSKLFIRDVNFQETSRNVGGVNLQVIETDFGRCNVMLNRYMPAGKLVAASLEDLKPAFLEIPGRGHFFAMPLAAAGAADRVQVYGEIGLNYGNQRKHAVLTTTPKG